MHSEGSRRLPADLGGGVALDSGLAHRAHGSLGDNGKGTRAACESRRAGRGC